MNTRRFPGTGKKLAGAPAKGSEQDGQVGAAAGFEHGAGRGPSCRALKREDRDAETRRLVCSV